MVYFRIKTRVYGLLTSKGFLKTCDDFQNFWIFTLHHGHQSFSSGEFIKSEITFGVRGEISKKLPTAGLSQCTFCAGYFWHFKLRWRATFFYLAVHLLNYIEISKNRLWPPNDPKMTWNELKGMKLTFKSYRPVFCSVPQFNQRTTSISQ